MDDHYLLTIALITAFIGIIALLALSYYNQVPERAINSLSQDDSEKFVSIKGQASSIRHTPDNKTTFFKVRQECEISVVLFDKMDISNGTIVKVDGTYQENSYGQELIADKITTVGNK